MWTISNGVNKVEYTANCELVVNGKVVDRLTPQEAGYEKSKYMAFYGYKEVTEMYDFNRDMILNGPSPELVLLGALRSLLLGEMDMPRKYIDNRVAELYGFYDKRREIDRFNGGRR